MSTLDHLRALDQLCCPETRQSLDPADEELCDELNAGIQEGELCDESGEVVDRSIEGALVRSDGEVAYPIRNGIPNLLLDDRIPLEEDSD